LWITARGLYGFAICGLFIVAQSWLNDAVENAIRGRVMAVFYLAYIGALGIGYYTLALIDIETAAAPLIGIAFTAISILPVGLTRLTQPPPPTAASVALAKAWRISPVGLAGMLAVGGLSMSLDRKSTRLNSSHVKISYAVFCLKKKKITQHEHRRPSRAP